MVIFTGPLGIFSMRWLLESQECNAISPKQRTTKVVCFNGVNVFDFIYLSVSQ